MRFGRRLLGVAVQSALFATAVIPTGHAADAVDPFVLELIRPANMVELGAGYVNKDSFKFGEYNGLEKKGAFAIGAFDVRGGGLYDSDDPYRWRVFGTNLGLENRNVGIDVGKQGSWRLRYSYDELRRNYSDSYQTFYSGAGTTTQTIPAFAGVPAANRLSSTTTAAGALSNRHRTRPRRARRPAVCPPPPARARAIAFRPRCKMSTSRPSGRSMISITRRSSRPTCS
jgi:Putative outer membrane beta-barrel porin, MtrB/PioB